MCVEEEGNTHTTKRIPGILIHSTVTSTVEGILLLQITTMIRLSSRVPLSQLRSVRSIVRPQTFGRIAGVAMTTSAFSQFSSFHMCNAVAQPEMAQKVFVPKILTTVVSESTTEFLKRKIKEVYDWLRRFFLATKRTAVCTAVISTAVVISPIALFFGKEQFVWNYIVDSIQFLGPTFIKLAQWASSRPDLFS
jgi:hypothetical protein